MRRIQHQKPYRVYTIWMKPVLGQLNATQEENKVQARILKKYQEFLLMFREKAHKKLSKHQD